MLIHVREAQKISTSDIFSKTQSVVKGFKNAKYWFLFYSSEHRLLILWNYWDEEVQLLIRAKSTRGEKTIIWLNMNNFVMNILYCKTIRDEEANSMTRAF